MKFTVQSLHQEQTLDFAVKRVFCIGYAGRNQKKVQEHIDELAKIGVPAPLRTPTVYPVSKCLFTNNAEIFVQREKTCGEVEFVLLLQNDKIYVSVGSDHTDRDLETYSVEKSKQMCEKPVAANAWSYDDVKDHWDELVLRSWVTDEKGKRLCQEGKVTALFPVIELIEVVKRESTADMNGAVVYSGTVPMHEGFVYAPKWDIELHDPVLNRQLTHSYTVTVLGEEMRD